MKAYSLRAARDGKGYMLHIAGHGPCPVGPIYRLLPMWARRIWWLGYALRVARIRINSALFPQ